MPSRILSLAEPFLIATYNTAYLIISLNPLSVILFIIGFLWQYSRIKMHIQKYHNGSVKAWWKWLLKKN